MNTFDSLYQLISVILLISCVILISATLYSMGKAGDERRNAIVTKAAAGAFYALIIILIFKALNIHLLYLGKGNEALTILSIAALFYLILMAYYKRKFGD